MIDFKNIFPCPPPPTATTTTPPHTENHIFMDVNVNLLLWIWAQIKYPFSWMGIPTSVWQITLTFLNPFIKNTFKKSNFVINEVFLIGVNATTVKKYSGKYLRSLNRGVYELFNDKKWKQREWRKLYSNTTQDKRTQCRTIVTAGAGLWKQNCADERIFPQAIYILTDSRAYLFSVFPFPFIRNKLMTK